VQFIQLQVNILVDIPSHPLHIGMDTMELTNIRLIDTLLTADIIVGKELEKITSITFFSEVLVFF
jgi:hypothetical protein